MASHVWQMSPQSCQGKEAEEAEAGPHVVLATPLVLEIWKPMRACAMHCPHFSLFRFLSFRAYLSSFLDTYHIFYCSHMIYVVYIGYCTLSVCLMSSLRSNDSIIARHPASFISTTFNKSLLEWYVVLEPGISNGVFQCSLDWDGLWPVICSGSRL